MRVCDLVLVRAPRVPASPSPEAPPLNRLLPPAPVLPGAAEMARQDGNVAPSRGGRASPSPGAPRRLTLPLVSESGRDGETERME